MTTQVDNETAFVRSLNGLLRRGDRGALAALRRGLGRPPGEAPEMYPYVVPALPEEAIPRVEDAYFLVASLFGLWHQGAGRKEPGDSRGAPFNLGASLAALVQRAPGSRDGIERRFTALLSTRGGDLPHHLRHAVALLRSEDIAIDWSRLLKDVLAWDSGRRVQRAWARSFWGAIPGQDSDEGAEEDK